MTSVVSFCFDDGFAASTRTTRRIFEDLGAKATFAALAAPGASVDPAHRGAAFVDWGWWREAVAAGHEVAPHGYAHERLADLRPDVARDSVRRCLDVFERELPGFTRRDAVFHVPYLVAPPGLLAWLEGQVLGIRLRTAGTGRNHGRAFRRGDPVDCAACVPPDVEASLERHLAGLRTDVAGEWRVVVLHGVDGEGWGPVGSRVLRQTVAELLGRGVRIEPLGQELARRIAAGASAGVEARP